MRLKSKDDELMFEAYKKSKMKKEAPVEEAKDVCNCYDGEICEPCKRKKEKEQAK